MAEEAEEEAEDGAEGWGKGALELGLGGDVLEDEVEDAAGGEEHDGTDGGREAGEEEVAGGAAEGAEGDEEEEEEREALAEGGLGRGEFAVGVEALGEILEADEEGEEEGERGVGGGGGTEGEGHGGEENAAAEGNDGVTEFLLEPAGVEVLDPAQPGTEGNGEAGEGGEEEDLEHGCWLLGRWGDGEMGTPNIERRIWNVEY